MLGFSDTQRGDFLCVWARASISRILIFRNIFSCTAKMPIVLLLCCVVLLSPPSQVPNPEPRQQKGIAISFAALHYPSKSFWTKCTVAVLLMQSTQRVINALIPNPSLLSLLAHPKNPSQIRTENIRVWQTHSWHRDLLQTKLIISPSFYLRAASGIEWRVFCARIKTR